MADIFQVRPSVSLDTAKCIGCGACADICPRHAITISQHDGFDIIRYSYGTCLYCRQCAQVCPEKAIEYTGTCEPVKFDTELYAEDKANLELEICQKCGAAYTPKPMLVKVQESLRESGYEAPESIRLCSRCRNKELVSNYWLVWKGKK